MPISTRHPDTAEQRGGIGPVRLVCRLCGALLLLVAAACWCLWIVGILWTDRTLFTQYLYWGGLPLLTAAVLAALAGLVLRAGGPKSRLHRRIARITRWAVLLSVLCAGWNLLHAGSLFARGTTLESGGRSIAVLQWNASLDSGIAPKYFLGRLEDEPPPDVMVITAFLPGATRIALARHLGESGDSAQAMGISLYSRLPILSSQSWTFDLSAARSGDLSRPSPALTRFAHWVFSKAHAAWRTPSGAELATLLVVKLDATATLGRPITVYAVDLPSNPAMSRWFAAELLAGRIAELQTADTGRIDPPDLVLGDFNTPQGSASLGLLAPGMHPVSAAGGLGIRATWPRQRPMLHIDHAFVASWLRVCDYRIIDPGRSEHRAQCFQLAPAR